MKTHFLAGVAVACTLSFTLVAEAFRPADSFASVAPAFRPADSFASVAQAFRPADAGLKPRATSSS